MNRNQINLNSSFPLAYDEHLTKFPSFEDTSFKFVPLYENFGTNVLPTPTSTPSGPSTPLIATMPKLVPIPAHLQSESDNESASNVNSTSSKLTLSSIHQSATPAIVLSVPTQEYVNFQREKQGIFSTQNMVRLGLLLIIVIIAIFIYFKSTSNNNNTLGN
jgi:hypothetical protein